MSTNHVEKNQYTAAEAQRALQQTAASQLQAAEAPWAQAAEGLEQHL